MEPRFIVDVNAGKLAKWLRALGCDVLFINPIDDDDLINIARRQGRIILTRDSYIPSRRAVSHGDVRVLLLSSELWREQLREVIAALGLTELAHPFSRCIECNALLEDRDHSWAEGKVPPYVLSTQILFKQCPQCQKVYWRGTHWERMREELGAPFAS